MACSIDCFTFKTVGLKISCKVESIHSDGGPDEAAIERISSGAISSHGSRDGSLSSSAKLLSTVSRDGVNLETLSALA